LNASASLHYVELHLASETFLLELAGNQAGGERRCEQRRLQFFGEIGKRADMILVPVGGNNARQPLLLALDELKIGKDQLDPRIGRVSESQAEIDHDPLATAAVEVDVHADLAGAAERDEQQFFAGDHWRLRVAMS